MLRLLFVSLVFISLINVNAYAQSKPIAIDSRIKTFIYSENEVFHISINYGYQTSIEFAEGEEVQTISVGNNYAWQLTPIGRRLFIKPLEENILTNMTLLTNKRAYQFEVQSKSPSYTIDDDLVYVIRFFYPDKDFDKTKPKLESIEQDPVPVIKPYNFNYTISGPDSIAPVKIFDDGINTFFKFDENLQVIPKISVLEENKYVETTPRVRGDYILVNTVAERFRVSNDNINVEVFNENMVKDNKK